MRATILFAILLVFMNPIHLLATAVHIFKYKRPNGTFVTVIGDVHLESNSERKQRKALLYAHKHSKIILLAEDPCKLGVPAKCCPSSFIPGIIKNAQSKGIVSRSIELRQGRVDILKNGIEIINPLIDHLLSKCLAIAAIVPTPFTESVHHIATALKQLQNECTKQLPLSACMELHSRFESLENKLTDLAFLAEIINTPQSDVIICIGDMHAEFLKKAFNDLGYLQMGSFGGGYTNEELINNINKCALDLKKSLRLLS